MVMSASTLALLCRGVATALMPLGSSLDPDRAGALFADLGLELPAWVYDDPEWRTALIGARDAAADLPGQVDQLSAAISSGDTTAVVACTSALAGGIAALRSQLVDVGNRLTALAPAIPGLPPEIAGQLPTRVLDMMVVSHLERTTRGLVNALALIGLIERRSEPGWPADPARSAVMVRRLRLDRLGPLLSAPTDHLKTLHGWGDPAFDGLHLLSQLREAGRLASLPAVLVDGPSGLLLDLLGGTVAADQGTSPPGLRASLRFPLPAGPPVDLVLARPGWRVRLTIGADLPSGLGVTVTPPGTIVVTPPPGAPVVAGAVGAEVTVTPVPPQTHLVLLAQPGLPRLEAASFTATARATVVWDAASGSARAEPMLELGVQGGRFVIELDGAGDLVRALIPKDRMQAELDLAIRWSQGRIHLRGGAGLRASFPVHLSLGPVDMQKVTVGLDPSDDGGLAVELSADLHTVLGPLSLIIERIGVVANVAFPTGGGNAGPLDLSFGFRAPGGIALSLAAGPVAGGGYLALDPAGGRYAGVLQLKLLFVNAVAYGVYEQADGRAAFVAVLGVRFTPGIQLGFGFALTGVGGLVGINRRANVDLLRERLASGAAGNVLFCEDPVRNAPTLLGDLAAFFPPADGGFLVGPTVQVSWLAPIVRIDLGLLIELPGPARVIVLGSVRVMIGRDETLALLYLRMDVLGDVDVEGRRISLDAALVSSHALGVLRLTGGMAFRLDYGANPYVLFSVGGFHPRFDPGPLALPTLARVGASLDVSVVASVYLRLEMYVAFTSNTLQAGARVEAGLDLGPLSARGHFVFDAIIQFRPFHFALTFSAGFSVRAFGISFASVDITGRISGPGPLVVYARGRVRRFGIPVSGSATFELGSRDGDRVAAIASPVHELAGELGLTTNLRTEGSDPTVVPSPDRPVVAGALVSPKGSLIWEQKRAPLDTLIHRLGGVPLAGHHQLWIEPPPGWSPAVERDWFSCGGFTNLDLSASLNNATFAELPSGVRLGGSVDVHAPTVVPYTDDIDLVKRPTLDRFTHLVVGGYLTGPLHATLRDRAATPPVVAGPPKVTVLPETADVYAGDGAARYVGAAPFQAFQFAHAEGGVAIPTADVAVAL